MTYSTAIPGRSSGGQGAVAQPAASITAGARAILVLFVITLFIPASYDVAGMNLSVNRLFVLVAFIPLVLAWLSGQAGRITAIDILIMLHGLWMLLSLVVVHGLGRFPYGSMLFVELFGGYLVGRILIRDPAAFKTLFATLLTILVILIPFTLYELKTGDAIVQDISRAVLGSAHNDVQHDLRFGLNRVQSAIQHPILFGVLCSFAIGNALFIWRANLAGGLARAGFALFMTFTSLSSGPLLAGVLQICLVLWGWVTRGAWKVLMWVSAGLYVFLSVASNRGPVIILIETLTFNSGTGWTRIHIWRHTQDDILRHPIFGIGLGDWTRPSWLTGSVDNFWLLTALRSGLVGFGLLALALAWHLWRTSRAEDLPSRERQLRTGYMITLVGTILSLATVHIWGPPFVFLMAYIGAGAMFYTIHRPETALDDAEPPPVAATRGPVYSRQSERISRGEASPDPSRPGPPAPGGRAPDHARRPEVQSRALPRHDTIPQGARPLSRGGSGSPEKGKR